MTVIEQIQTFIPKAITKVRAIQTKLNENFDYSGYQSSDSKLMSLQITETYNLITLLTSYNFGGATERQVRDLMDFFTLWLDLNKVVSSYYTGYQLPIQGNVEVPSGDYALQVSLNAEILARITADNSLHLRILVLENAGNPGGLPSGWDDNYATTYAVVFNDDARLHTHNNKEELDEITETDVENIKSLSDHFSSLGGPSGQHVTPEDRERWDAMSEVGGDPDVYDRNSPSTIAVGHMPIGTPLTGRTPVDILEQILVSFLLPLFGSFGNSVPALFEVGTILSGIKLFTWSLSNSVNVEPNSIAIRDVTTNNIIASGLADDGSQNVDIGVISNLVPITHSWRGEGLDTNLNPITPSALKTVQSIYPYFYGKVASGGLPPGDGRPGSNQALINGGTKVVGDSNGTVVINFATSSDEYAWFAIPLTSAAKLSWFVDTLNSGPIGGIIDPGGNLFPDFETVNINSPTALWGGVQYKIYVANYQSEIVGPMQLRNTA